MLPVEIWVIALVVVVVALSALAQRLSVPYPIVLVLGGAVLGFVPGLPAVHLEPELVLVVFLPPLLYNASVFANVGDLAENKKWLVLNTVPLVLLTMVLVAVVAHALIPDLTWGAAFVLGAIVSPTDSVAPGVVMRQLGAPRNLVSIVEGEGLFNDATALTAYRAAVAAAVSGTFSLGSSSLRFVLGAVGGVLIGLAVGWVAARVRRRVEDAQLSVILSLLTAYVAYIPADVLGASGVLATVSAGLYVGVRAPTTLPPQSRLQGTVVWNLLDLVLNAILFTLVGLELHNAIEALAGDRAPTLVGWALAVAGVAVLVRLVWFFTVPYAVRAVDRDSVPADRRANAKGRLVVAWSGMRGAVSLAVALAVPTTSSSGAPFPGRDLIVFLTFAVILITLVVQGLTLPVLIRWLGVKDPEADEHEELVARLAASRAALDQVERLAAEDWTGEDTVERLRGQYQFREARLAARAGEKADDGYEDRSQSYQRAVLEVLGAQRDALLELRQAGSLSNTTLNRLVHELDLEESRLESGNAD